jgi:hypothetical protein
MNVRGFAILFACLASLVAAGCDDRKPPSDARSSTPVEAKAKPRAEIIPAYAYDAPVKGHISESNVGTFDVVDGIAYAALAGQGTVVYVASKSIASPMLVESACPLAQARALSKLRNASFAEVTLDANGRSKYFAAGMPFGGGLVDRTAGAWTSTLKRDAGRADGSVTHVRYGHFEFDMPLSNPKVDEMSNGDRDVTRRPPATTPKPTEQAVTDAYIALRDAALRKDLKATLAAMGFDPKQITAIRGMDGIDADFQVFANRFLAPGTTGDPSTRAGAGNVRGEGVKADGRKYFNDYYFDLCQDRLVLTGIVEQSP